MPRRREVSFSETHREALIIRWRSLIKLGLLDYFTNERNFSKLITKELMDMQEGVIKALADGLGIRTNRRNYPDILREVLSKPELSSEKRNKIRRADKSLRGPELSSLRRLFRNPEAHTLNLPEVPQESLIRCCRTFRELVEACDEKLLEYAKTRPELQDFYFLGLFFHRYIIEGEYFDLRKIKSVQKTVTGRDQRSRSKTVTADLERSPYELIQYISTGNWIKKRTEGGA